MQRDSRAPADAPPVTVMDITEPTAVSANLGLIEQEGVQLQPLPLRARRVMVRLRSVMVLLSSTDRRLRTHTHVHAGRIGYVVFGPEATGTVNGWPVRPGLMLAAGPESDATFVVDAGWESIAVLLPPEEVRAHLAARQCGRAFQAPHGIEALQADPGDARRLFDWGKRLTTTAAQRPTNFNEGTRAQAAAEVEMYETLLPILAAAEPVEPTRGERTRQAHSVIVKAAEDYAMNRVGEPCSVTDLCRATGVSQRTLEYAFRDVMGLSPVAYLIRLRLHRVRQGLLKGTPGTTTVSAEAANGGFWHFGDFSRAYQECFGELPSHTLRRPLPGPR